MARPQLPFSLPSSFPTVSCLTAKKVIDDYDSRSSSSSSSFYHSPLSSTSSSPARVNEINKRNLAIKPKWPFFHLVTRRRRSSPGPDRDVMERCSNDMTKSNLEGLLKLESLEPETRATPELISFDGELRRLSSVEYHEAASCFRDDRSEDDHTYDYGSSSKPTKVASSEFSDRRRGLGTASVGREKQVAVQTSFKKLTTIVKNEMKLKVLKVSKAAKRKFGCFGCSLVKAQKRFAPKFLFRKKEECFYERRIPMGRRCQVQQTSEGCTI